MKQVTWSAFAVKCLFEIQEYILLESNSQTIADHFVQKIIQRIDQLSYAPASGQKEPLLSKFRGEYRYLVEGNYKIMAYY